MNGIMGHMPHIIENLDFTFQEICDILSAIEFGSLPSVEKIDGINLCISLKKEKDKIKLIAARNLDETKNGLNFENFKEKWEGHPAEIPFIEAFKFLESIFENEICFNILENKYLNLEIIFPKQKNVIKYDKSAIVCHSLFEINHKNEIENDYFGFDYLMDIILQNDYENNEWSILGPNYFSFNGKKESKIAYEKIQNKFGDLELTLKDWIKINLYKDLNEIGLNQVKIKNCVDVAFQNIDLPITSVTKGLPELTKKRVSAIASKAGFKKYCLNKLEPLDDIINEFYKKIIINQKSYLINDQKTEINRLKFELNNALQSLLSHASLGDKNILEYLKNNKNKIEKSKSIYTPIEGIVFEWPEESGKKYKITAEFSIINQIINRELKLQGKYNNRIIKSRKTNENHNVKIGLVPISAKPYHAGHDYLIQMAAKQNDIVKVFVSLKDRKRNGEFPILGESMKTIWENEIKPNLPAHAEVYYVTSPIQATILEVSEYSKKEFAVFKIYSDVIDTHTNFSQKMREKYMINNNATCVFPSELNPNEFIRGKNAPNVSGSAIREALFNNDFNKFCLMMPSWINKKYVWKILKNY